MMNMNKYRCVKQTVFAIIKTPDGRIYTGQNWCEKPQKECPRKDMPTGVGYEKCVEICGQKSHAEIDAIENSRGDDLKGSTCYLLGHTYVCDKCKDGLKEWGVEKIVVIKESE